MTVPFQVAVVMSLRRGRPSRYSVLASGDATYTGNLTARTAAFATASAAPGVLTLPVAAADLVAPSAPTPGPAAATPGSPGGTRTACAPRDHQRPPAAALCASHGHSRPRARAPRHPHGRWRSQEKQQASL